MQWCTSRTGRPGRGARRDQAGRSSQTWKHVAGVLHKLIHVQHAPSSPATARIGVHMRWLCARAWGEGRALRA